MDDRNQEEETQSPQPQQIDPELLRAIVNGDLISFESILGTDVQPNTEAPRVTNNGGNSVVRGVTCGENNALHVVAGVVMEKTSQTLLCKQIFLGSLTAIVVNWVYICFLMKHWNIGLIPIYPMCCSIIIYGVIIFVRVKFPQIPQKIYEKAKITRWLKWVLNLSFYKKKMYMEIAEKIYDQDATLLYARNCAGETPLHCAANSGNLDMVSLLVQFAYTEEDPPNLGPLLQARNKVGETALHGAARSGYSGIVDVLLCADRTVAGLKDKDEISPLYLAVTSGCLDVVQQLIAAGNPPTADGNPARAAENPPRAAGIPITAAGNPPTNAENPPRAAANPVTAAANPPRAVGNPVIVAANSPTNAENLPRAAANPVTAAANPPTNAENPPRAAENPVTTAANPPTNAGNPPRAVGNMVTTAANPPTNVENPPRDARNPPRAAENSVTAAGNLATAAANLATPAANPATIDGNSATADGNPPIVVGNPPTIDENLPSYAGPDGQNALHAAVMRQKETITRAILEWKPCLANETDTAGNTPLHYAALIGNTCAVRELLLKDTGSAYKANKSGSFPVHLAAKAGKIKVIKELLSMCPDVGELLDKEKRNFLHVAVEKKRIEIITWACKKGINAAVMNAKDNDGNTPLHLAVISSESEIFGLFLKTKIVRPNIRNKAGLTPLDISASLQDQHLKYSLIPQNVIYRALLHNGAFQNPCQPADLSKMVGNLVKARADCPNRTEGKEMCNDVEDDIEKEITDCENKSRSLTTGAVLISSATFVGIFTVSKFYGDIDTSDDDIGIKYYFIVFVVVDMLAFICSIVSTIWLLYAGLSNFFPKYRKIYFRYCTPLLYIALHLFILAFGLGSYIAIVPLNLDLANGILRTIVFCFCFTILWNPKVFIVRIILGQLQKLG